jgi:hypothetical protein
LDFTKHNLEYSVIRVLEVNFFTRISNFLKQGLQSLLNVIKFVVEISLTVLPAVI